MLLRKPTHANYRSPVFAQKDEHHAQRAGNHPRLACCSLSSLCGQIERELHKAGKVLEEVDGLVIGDEECFASNVEWTRGREVEHVLGELIEQLGIWVRLDSGPCGAVNAVSVTDTLGGGDSEGGALHVGARW